MSGEQPSKPLTWADEVSLAEEADGERGYDQPREVRSARMREATCKACPMPDQTAALELVRLREGIGRLASEWEGWARYRSTTRIDAFRDAAEQLRALLDDNEGERS